MQSQQRRLGFEKLIELASYTLEDYVERIATHRKHQATQADQAETTDTTTTNVQKDHQGAQQDQQPPREKIETPEDDREPSDRGGHNPEDAGGVDHIDQVDHVNAQDPYDEPAANQRNDDEQDQHQQHQQHGQDQSQGPSTDQPEQHEPENEEDVENTTEPADKEDEALYNIAPASQLTGEQFYRNDISFPNEPPDAKLALTGRKGQISQEDDSDDSDHKQPWHQRLKDYLKQGALAIAKSTARTVFKLVTLFAGLYIVLVLPFALLIPGGAFDGMWKWLAITVIICALLRSRLRSRADRFQRGTLSPGEKK